MSIKAHQAKIAVVGDASSIMIFKALGFITVAADERSAIEKAVRKLAQEDTAVIYITETAAAEVPETISDYKTAPFPAIIPIPDRFGSQGIGMKGIKDNVEKAIGADIL